MFEKIISKNPGEDSSIAPPPAPAAPAPAKPSDLSQTAKPPVATGSRNVLLPDVEIKGKVRFENDLIVDGKIEGEITSDGSLTVGENAKIRAEIKTRSLVVYGKVHGNITVSERIELRANAEVIGDIKAAVLAMDAGAVFVGSSTVGAPSSQETARPKQQNKPPQQSKPNQNAGGGNRNPNKQSVKAAS